MNRLITELMNDEAVYRTAPATPGLLNILVGKVPNRKWKTNQVSICGQIARALTKGLENIA